MPHEPGGENYLPVVVGVAVVGDHVLRILFSDGTVGDVDFSAEHWTGVPESLNDPAYLAMASVDAEAGTLVWPGGSIWRQRPCTTRHALTLSPQPDLSRIFPQLTGEL